MTKVVVIGARRRRQGIGEFLARSFASAGAQVSAVVGTSPETVEQARAQLAQRHGIRCRAYASVTEALEREAPDVVVICSPFESHREQLEAVLTAGAHCLCEKPLIWDERGDRIAAAARIVDGFIARKRQLSLVIQWPYTLPAFFEIYPQAKDRPIARFQMTLSPIRSGPRMILDAAPHPLSMLQHLVGYGEVLAPEVRFTDADQRALEMVFEYRHGAGGTQVEFKTSVHESIPRPASYAINGLRVEREIALPEYRISFVGAERRIAIRDPIEMLVEDFLNKVQGRPTTDRRALIESIAGLETLYRASGDRAAVGGRAHASPA